MVWVAKATIQSHSDIERENGNRILKGNDNEEIKFSIN